MATYVVCFRLDYDANYSDRWASVVNAIKAEADGGTFWEEMTSLIVFKSSKAADSVASSIYVGSALDSTKDTLLVVNASTGTYATRGKIDYPATLASLFSQQNTLSSLFG